MAHTDRRDPPGGALNKESKRNRQLWWRQNRKAVSQRLHMRDGDPPAGPRKTGGWMTW